jgi:hypothetical protein
MAKNKRKKQKIASLFYKEKEEYEDFGSAIIGDRDKEVIFPQEEQDRQTIKHDFYEEKKKKKRRVG